jgi:hypothetical protein
MSSSLLLVTLTGRYGSAACPSVFSCGVLTPVPSVGSSCRWSKRGRPTCAFHRTSSAHLVSPPVVDTHRARRHLCDPTARVCLSVERLCQSNEPMSFNFEWPSFSEAFYTDAREMLAQVSA